MMKSLDFKVLTNLVDAKPFADAYTMVNMIAWQFDLSSPSFVPRLANYTPTFPNNSIINGVMPKDYRIQTRIPLPLQLSETTTRMKKWIRYFLSQPALENR